MSQRLACRLALLAMWWCGVGGASATAAAPDLDPVVLDTSGCQQLNDAALRPLIALEVAPRPLVQGTFPESGTTVTRTHARLGCSEEHVQLSVREPARGEPLRLDLDLSATATQARARLVALTLTELIATARLEPAAPAKTEAEAATPVAHSEPKPATSVDSEGRVGASPSHLLWMGLGMVRQGRPRLLGAALDVGSWLRLGRSPVGILIDATATLAGRTLNEGKVRARTYSGAAMLGASARWAPLELFAAAGLRAGFARLDGLQAQGALEGRSVTGPWVGPGVSLGGTVRLASRFALRAATEFVYVAQTVRGEGTAGRTLYALDWAYLSFGVGVGYRL